VVAGAVTAAGDPPFFATGFLFAAVFLAGGVTALTLTPARARAGPAFAPGPLRVDF